MVSRSFELQKEKSPGTPDAFFNIFLPDSVMEAHVTLTHRVQVRTLVGQPIELIAKI